MVGLTRRLRPHRNIQKVGFMIETNVKTMVHTVLICGPGLPMIHQVPIFVAHVVTSSGLTAMETVTVTTVASVLGIEMHSLMMQLNILTQMKMDLVIILKEITMTIAQLFGVTQPLTETVVLILMVTDIQTKTQLGLHTQKGLPMLYPMTHYNG